MRFTIIFIPNTVIAYDVTEDGKNLGQVFLRDEYWHAKANGSEKLAQGGPGFTHGRGYTSRHEAASALGTARWWS